MFFVRDFWRRHRRKIFISVGVIGGGYCLYNLYGVHRQKLDGLERELQVQRESEERFKYQMQAHFENIQRISETITLPHSMHNLSCRISEELDLSHLLERLMQGKGQPNALTQSEKLDLWGRLKILSFTRMALSVWATVMLSLYTKVQVNILGRHLYIDTARSFEVSSLMELIPFGDGRKVEKILQFMNCELKNNADLQAMWSTYESFREKVPIELDATLSRTVDDIMRMLQLPPRY